MPNKKLTRERIEEIMKEIELGNKDSFPKYDEFGNVIIENKGGLVMMKANEFHEAMKERVNLNDDIIEHYMIYQNGRFIKDVYSFAEVQDYYDKYFLYGKITHTKV